MDVNLHNALWDIYRLWWPQFKLDIRVLFTGTITKSEYMALNLKVYELLEHHYIQSKRLYEDLQQFFIEYASITLAKLNHLSGEALLRQYVMAWMNFFRGSQILQGICSSLNSWIKQEYVPKRRTVYMIHQLFVVIWKDILLTRLIGKLTETLLRMIDYERNTAGIDRFLVMTVLTSYVQCGLKDMGTLVLQSSSRIYRSYFEDAYLRASDEYHENKKVALRKLLDEDEFMQSITRVQLIDLTNAKCYLPNITVDKLLQIFNDHPHEE